MSRYPYDVVAPSGTTARDFDGAGAIVGHSPHRVREHRGRLDEDAHDGLAFVIRAFVPGEDLEVENQRWITPRTQYPGVLRHL